MRNRSRRLAALASIAALGTIVGLAAPAGAGPTVLTGAKHSVAAAGSDTSYWMMSLISPSYNVNTVNNAEGDYVTQIPPVNTAPFPAGTFVPGDAVAASSLWDSSVAGQPPTPPDGSSAGITASTVTPRATSTSPARHADPTPVRPLRSSSGRTRSVQPTT